MAIWTPNTKIGKLVTCTCLRINNIMQLSAAGMQTVKVKIAMGLNTSLQSHAQAYSLAQKC